MVRVLITSELPGDAFDRLRATCDAVVGSIDQDLSSFDALVTLLSDRVDKALLDRAPRVRIVANVAVGVDNVDLETCKARGVRVTLAEVLETGPLGAAGLDVFEDEPHVNENLLKRNNVVLTPHIASADRRTRAAMARLAVDSVLAFSRGEALLTGVV